MILNQDTIIVLMFQKLIDNYVAYQKTYYVKMIIQNTTSNSINFLYGKFDNIIIHEFDN